MANRFKRILLKLSGEAVARKNTLIEKESGKEVKVQTELYDDEKLNEIAAVIKELVDDGTEVAIVIGAGNIWRGAKTEDTVFNRARADHMGMLATVINSLRIEEALCEIGVPATVMSPVAMNSFVQPYDFRTADEALKNGKVVIMGCGLGVPFISTDTAAVVRAKEIGADVVLMAKNVDGVYDKDPGKNPDARRFEILTYDYCTDNNLKAIDLTAAEIAGAQKIDTYAFALKDPRNIIRAVRGEKVGTLITAEKTEVKLYD